ncbi:AAA family ATPase [Streptomyces sp. NBC_01381]|uniref:hypothetical protein n=1 Tax=Streptomyces sp. NBC_01381 TaxID=2903845 RepID=UPI00225AFE64|nr:hypothetical protein [Streptomyces sp. NBC_01381]MCX4666441.1 AAA family ATPase [Streptomyces sp. NBC_01381]
MLLMLTGSSCSGKSTLAFAAAKHLQYLAVHDTDESGVPDNPPPHWRNLNTEEWIRRALDYQQQGIDLLLTGQAPLGEILAAPSAPSLNGIAVCLVEVAEAERRKRLATRDQGRWSEAQTEAFINWAAWHRAHALDPHHRPDVITSKGAPETAWQRWTSWAADDPRWDTYVLDTTERTEEECVEELAQWITRQRELDLAGQLPLSGDWATRL